MVVWTGMVGVKLNSSSELWKNFLIHWLYDMKNSSLGCFQGFLFKQLDKHLIYWHNEDWETRSLGVLFAFGLGQFAMTDRYLSRAVKEVMWHLSLEFSGEVRIGDIHGGLVCTWHYVMCRHCFYSAVQLSSLCIEDSQYTDCALPPSLKIIPSHPHNLISCSVTEFLIFFFPATWKTTEDSMHCIQWPQGQVHVPTKVPSEQLWSIYKG